MIQKSKHKENIQKNYVFGIRNKCWRGIKGHKKSRESPTRREANCVAYALSKSICRLIDKKETRTYLLYIMFYYKLCIVYGICTSAVVL